MPRCTENSQLILDVFGNWREGWKRVKKAFARLMFLYIPSPYLGHWFGTMSAGCTVQVYALDLQASDGIVQIHGFFAFVGGIGLFPNTTVELWHSHFQICLHTLKLKWIVSKWLSHRTKFHSWERFCWKKLEEKIQTIKGNIFTIGYNITALYSEHLPVK